MHTNMHNYFANTMLSTHQNGSDITPIASKMYIIISMHSTIKRSKSLTANVLISCPFSISHNLAFESILPVASTVLCGLNARQTWKNKIASMSKFSCPDSHRLVVHRTTKSSKALTALNPWSPELITIIC